MAFVKLSKERLETSLVRRLKLRDAEFHLERAGDRLVGDIVSPTFKGKPDHQRQNLIWDALDAEFGADVRHRVGMLLAYTPEEWNLGEEGQPAVKKARKAG